MAAGDRLGVPQHCTAGEIIFHETDPGDAMYVILSGLVKVSRTTEDGRQKVLALLAEGDFFGEMALVDGGPRSAEAAAMEDTVLVSIRRKDFQEWITANPTVAWGVIQGLSRRLRAANDQLMEATFLAAQERVVQTLRRLAGSHGEPLPGGGGRRLERPFTQEELAQLAGTARETVSRVLGRLQDMGLVRWEGRRLIWLGQTEEDPTEPRKV